MFIFYYISNASVLMVPSCSDRIWSRLYNIHMLMASVCNVHRLIPRTCSVGRLVTYSNTSMTCSTWNVTILVILQHVTNLLQYWGYFNSYQLSNRLIVDQLSLNSGDNAGKIDENQLYILNSLILCWTWKRICMLTPKSYLYFGYEVLLLCFFGKAKS